MSKKWRALRNGLCAVFAVATLGCGAEQHEDELEADSEGSLEPGEGLSAQEAPPSLKFLDIQTSGMGCENLPKENILINAQQSAFTVFTPDFIVRSNKNDADSSAAMSCNLNIKVSAPKGWSYGVSKIYYTGRATLPLGMSANMLVNYGFEGVGQTPSTATFPIRVSQPGQEWKQVHQVDAVSFSPCDGKGSLLVSTNLKVAQTPLAPRSTWQNGWASLSTIDGETGKALSQTIAPNVKVVLVWKKCVT